MKERQVKIYYFDPSVLQGLPSDLIPPVPKGTPFLMDGAESVGIANRWLRSLSSLSSETKRRHATAIRSWAEFLASHGSDLSRSPESQRQLFTDYRRNEVLGGSEVGTHISAASWNLRLSSLNGFYDWANATQELEGYPFDFSSQVVRTAGGGSRTVRTNSTRLRSGRSGSSVTSISEEYMKLFVDVGLLGRNVETGQPSRSHRMARRRDVILGRMLFSTGLRIGEATNLLVWELPPRSQSLSGHVLFPVPEKVTKFSKSRQTIIDPVVLDDLHSYVALERQAIAFKKDWTPAEGGAIYVTNPQANGGVINGKFTKWHSLSIPERRRLVGPDGVSAALFLSPSGGPLTANAVRATFGKASKRCRAVVGDFPAVHPHMARHTFAMLTLARLLREALERIGKLERLLGEDARRIGYRVAHDPLRVLADCLGHKSIDTTMNYLDRLPFDAIISDFEIEAALLREEESES